jgi:cytidylate kinase
MTYRGIALFGAPGSGKTTVARILSEAFPTAKVIEASSRVIYPAAAIADRLPKGEAAFIRRMIVRPPRSRRVPREEARELFARLKRRYSEAVVAKTLIALHARTSPERLAIVAGIRGYRNAIHFKKHGYLVVYLKAPGTDLSARVSRREEFTQKQAEKERAIEERLFSTNMVAKIAHLSFDTLSVKPAALVARVKALVEAAECRRCLNASANLSGTIGPTGLCDVCEGFERHFDAAVLKRELETLRGLKGSGTGRFDAMVGISGGKDSTATLHEVMKMGFRPMAFTFDMGYYPGHIIPRARKVAKKLGVPYVKIDIRGYVRPADRASFRKTADLYDERETEELREKFRKWYVEGRRHYSVKCAHRLPFVRTCQLCRRVVVRAYYGEAVKRGVRVVILGINEWAGLSQDTKSKKSVYSGLRRLKPFRDMPAVTIVHLPFLLRRKIGDTRRILSKLGWRVPRGEDLIESNANSCLFARAAEAKAMRLLGFHPDATRLSREVTVGFITKAQARRALEKPHRSRASVRAVLKRARVL